VREYHKTTGAQRVAGQCDGFWTSPAGASLMIIECIEQTLIMRVHWTDALRPRNAETEQSGHLVVDHGFAHGVKLSSRQHIQQGRAGDKTMITRTVRQESAKQFDTAIDDHRIVRLRQ
jgi:hypothetical protein